MKPTIRKRWIISGLLAGFLVGWAVLAARAIINGGDSMVGFHPLIMLLLPVVGLASLASVVLLIIRKWQIAVGLGVGASALILVLFNGHRIQDEAWRRAIKSNAHINEAAMKTIQVNLAPGDFFDIWEEEKLTPLEKFRMRAFA